MKIRKGKKYIIVVNPFTNEVVIARRNRRYDWLISRNTVGLTIMDCNFTEAVHNLKLMTAVGYYVSKRNY